MKTKLLLTLLVISVLLTSCTSNPQNSNNQNSSPAQSNSNNSVSASSELGYKDYTEEELLQIIKDSVDEICLEESDFNGNIIEPVIYEESINWVSEKLEAEYVGVRYTTSQMDTIIVKVYDKNNFKIVDEWGKWTETTDSSPKYNYNSEFPYIVITSAHKFPIEMLNSVMAKLHS